MAVLFPDSPVYYIPLKLLKSDVSTQYNVIVNSKTRLIITSNLEWEPHEESILK